MADAKGWFRDRYAEAVWETEALRPNEKLVALVYAKYAGDKGNPDNDVAWVAWARLSQHTGIRSKGGLSRATKALVAAGWLVELSKRRQHYSPRYRIVIPDSPEVREVYVWEGDEPGSEVHETNLSDQASDSPEVAEMDNWDPPEVHPVTPEVADVTARGSGTGPEVSTDNQPDYSAVVAIGAQPQDAREAEHHTTDGHPRQQLYDAVWAALRGDTADPATPAYDVPTADYLDALAATDPPNLDLEEIHAEEAASWTSNPRSASPTDATTGGTGSDVILIEARAVLRPRIGPSSIWRSGTEA